MGETGIHVRVALWYVWGALWLHFSRNPRVAVEANMFVYYVKGDPKRVICPDVFVVKDVPDDPFRRSYRVWKEGKPPDLVIEVTSKKTRKEDLHKKFEICRDVLKVQEYFLFDPTEEYLDPSMRGYRLVSGRYEEIPWVMGALPSEVLGLHLQRQGIQLRFFDPATGKLLPIGDDLERQVEAREREVEARDREIVALRESRRKDAIALRKAEKAQLEAENARLKAENAQLEAKKGQLEAQAEAERLRNEIEALKTQLSERKG
jgi:Uma2 family endonuclease